MKNKKKLLKNYKEERELIRKKANIYKGTVDQRIWISILSSTTYAINIMSPQCKKSIRTKSSIYDENRLEFIFLKNRIHHDTNRHMSAYKIRYLRCLLATIRSIDRKILIEKNRELVSAHFLALENQVTQGYIEYHLKKARVQCVKYIEQTPYNPLTKYSNSVMNSLRMKFKN
jgi:hypothetical protein